MSQTRLEQNDYIFDSSIDEDADVTYYTERPPFPPIQQSAYFTKPIQRYTRTRRTPCLILTVSATNDVVTSAKYIVQAIA